MGGVTVRGNYPRNLGMRGRRMYGSGGQLAGALALLGLVFDASAAAQPPGKPVAPRLDLFVGAHYALGLGEVCQRDLDVDSCEGGQSFLGAQALVLVRPLEHLALGPSLSYGVTPSEDRTAAGTLDSKLALWQLAAEARYWLDYRRPVCAYLAIDGGYAFMNEQLAVPLDADAGTALPRKSSITQSGPLLGAAFGIGLQLPFGLGIVPSVRAFATFFGDDPESFTPDLEAHRFGTLYWVALCVDATFGFPL